MTPFLLLNIHFATIISINATCPLARKTGMKHPKLQLGTESGWVGKSIEVMHCVRGTFHPWSFTKALTKNYLRN